MRGYFGRGKCHHACISPACIVRCRWEGICHFFWRFGRRFVIPSGDLGGDSPFLLMIWHVYVITRSGDLALT